MKRGAYPMDLVRSLKIRIDEDTFERIDQLSKEGETSRSKIVRDIIIRNIFETDSIQDAA